jgi:2,4-dienoyl-CoA reductase (NADPH2)
MNALLTNEGPGNTIEDSVQVARWVEEAGADAIHVSSGGYFPHPRNPAGDLPIQDFLRVYDSMISSGTKTFRNFLLFRNGLSAKVFQSRWRKAAGKVFEGSNLADSAAIKQAVSIPVICTGGFQTASVIRSAIESDKCDAVSIARPLIANNDLVDQFARGLDRPERPCTYCNKCLVNVIENPLGCYDETRFTTREEMLAQILSVYDPAPFSAAAPQSLPANQGA